MSTITLRTCARSIAAPLILAVLVTAQATGTANASPAEPSGTPAITIHDEQRILRDLAREQLAERQEQLRERAERRARAAERREREAERRAREVAAIGERIVAAAAAQAGKPYVYGATGPSAFDCSGLTGWAYAAVGITLPRTSSAQAAIMTPVSDPQPGDLVYMPGHIGIYAGNGQMWHAPNSGDVVKLATIWSDAFRYGRVR